MAASADTQHLVATDATTNYGDWVSRSSDGGKTWTQDLILGSGNYIGLGSSADGSVLGTLWSQPLGGAAYFYYSTNGGSSWNQVNLGITPFNLPVNSWSSVAGSSDGQVWAAITYGTIYTTTTAAAASVWNTDTNLASGGVQDEPDLVALSADGSVRVVTTAPNAIYTNRLMKWTTAVPTWTDVTPPSAVRGSLTLSQTNRFAGTAISGNGTVIVTAIPADQGALFLSTNGGSTWTNSAPDSSVYYTGADLSNNGQRIIVYSSTALYLSTNGGSSFQKLTSAPQAGWSAAVVQKN